MWEHNVEEFITNVCKEIKYKKARNKISEELKNHIEDHAYDLMDNGVDEEAAYMQSIEAMGNPKEIGKNLNKQHRPYVGWLLNITNIIIGMICCFLGFIIILGVIGMIEPFQLPTGNDIKYTVKLHQKEKIDARTVVMKQAILDKNHNLLIRYNEYNDPFYQGWFMTEFTVYDDLGNKYGGFSSEVKGNIFGTRHLLCVDKINNKAKKVILEYDHYNRHMKFEIKLGGDENK